MLFSKTQETINYYPEKINNPNARPLTGHSSGINHMANWMACIRDRKQPNANVEVGYLSAIAVHMANLAYLQKRRVTIEEAMAAKPEAWMHPSNSPINYRWLNCLDWNTCWTKSIQTCGTY